MYCTETYNPAIGHLCWLTMHKGPEKLSPIMHMKVDHRVGCILYNMGANNWLWYLSDKIRIMYVHACMGTETLFTTQRPILNKLKQLSQESDRWQTRMTWSKCWKNCCAHCVYHQIKNGSAVDPVSSKYLGLVL